MQRVVSGVDVEAAGAIDLVDGGTEVLVQVELDIAVVVLGLHVGLLEEDGATGLLLQAPGGHVDFVILHVGGHIADCLEEHCSWVLPVVQFGSILVGPDGVPDGSSL